MAEPFPRGPGHPGLLGKLMAAVRVEFRRDSLVFDATDPVFGGPCCIVSECVRPARQRGMCLGHRQRWAAEGEPDLAKYIATTSPRWYGHSPLGSWGTSGSGRLAKLPSSLTAAIAAGVRLPDRLLRPVGAGRVPHHARWKSGRHPDLNEFIASCEAPGPGALMPTAASRWWPSAMAGMWSARATSGGYATTAATNG